MDKQQIEVVLPPNALTSPAPATGTPQAQYEPTLAQMMFGNTHGELDLGANERYVAEKLYELSEMLGKKNPDTQAHGLLGGEWGYGQDFKNNVFEMHSYWWGDCTCGFDHAPDCREVIPNFKCGDIEIRWYKYIGRGMSVNREVSREKLRQAFRRCRQSLK